MKTRLTLFAVLLLATSVSCTTVTRPDLSGMSFSSDPLIGKIIWHDLITEDMEAARRFYEGMFGWTFEERQSRDGRDYAIARLGEIYVAGIVHVEPRTDGNKLSRWLPYVSVDDVDQAVSRTITAGGELAVSARNVPLGRVAAIVDPEGAVVGLARSAIGDPDDRTTAAAPGKVVWNELLSNDAAAAADFYRQVMGYEVRTVERRGGDYTLLGANGNDRSGVLSNPVDEWPPVWLTYFGVRDAAEAAARAKSLGGSVLLDASPEVREGTMAVVADPSGAILVLQKWTS